MNASSPAASSNVRDNTAQATFDRVIAQTKALQAAARERKDVGLKSGKKELIDLSTEDDEQQVMFWMASWLGVTGG